MYYADYHLHSKYSFDVDNKNGSAEITALCDAAIAAGLDEIAITDHYDVNGLIMDGVCDVCDPGAVLTDVLEAKEKYKGRLTVTYGIELGQAAECPEFSKDVLSKYPFEFVIGSLHNMPGVPDYYFYDYSKMTQEYIDSLFSDNLKGLCQIADFDGLCTIAHFTYMHRYVLENGMDIDFKKFYPEIREFYRHVIDSGKALEINISTARVAGGVTMPTHELMKFYRECGGELVTCGTDSHGADYVGLGIKDTYEFLAEAGFKYITLFRDRKPFMQKIV